MKYDSLMHPSTFWRLAFAVFLLFALSSCTLEQATESAEQQFRSVIDARIEPNLKLETEYAQYNWTDTIYYRTTNLTGKPIYFRDYALDLQAYQYVSREHKWIRVPYQSPVLEQDRLTVVPPGIPQGLENINSVCACDILKTGNIRLVVIGWDDGSNPQGSKIAAFKDIEITSSPKQ